LENADDPNRLILVRRNYSRGEFTTPKHHKSRRVDMSREVRRVLLELRVGMAIKAFETGEEFVPRWVFPSATGRPLDGINAYHRDFVSCLEAAGLRRITFHAMRHSYASHLIQAGASLAYVKGAKGAQLDTRNGRYVRTFGPGREQCMGRQAGRRSNNSTSICNPDATRGKRTKQRITATSWKYWWARKDSNLGPTDY